MKKGTFLVLACAALFWHLRCFSAYSAELTNINFYQQGEMSHLELSFDSPLVLAKKFQVPDDKQIILDLKDVSANDKVIRAFDTSEFSGSVVFVSAYKKPNTKNDLRVAVQLRDNVRSVVKKSANKLILVVENRFGVFSQTEMDAHLDNEEGVLAQGKPSDLSGVETIHVPRSDSLEDILENLTMSGRKKYIGKKISFNVKNVSVEEMLNMIADSSGFNLILTEGVKNAPHLSLSLTNIAWDQALDMILGLSKLVAEKNGNILTIKTLQKATEEREQELKLKEKKIAEDPLVTKIFGISFASLGEMSKILTEYLTPSRGKISQDERTNSLIVKDTAENIERMKKIVEFLDTQTPQVLIESKIVEISENFSQEIGLANGINFGYDPLLSGESFQRTGPGFQFSSAAGASGGGIMNLNIAKLDRLMNLNFVLQMMESESKAKIISTPRVITQNNKAATISSTDTISYKTTSTSNGTTTESYATASANLTLNVTPKVTNEGSIDMNVDVTKGSFTAGSSGGPPPQTSRSVKTNILVDNGSTVVIGGIFVVLNKENVTGVPFLKDIPLIGWLFRSAYNPSTQKNEMVIFLTPRIINQEEAGLADKT